MTEDQKFRAMLAATIASGIIARMLDVYDSNGDLASGAVLMCGFSNKETAAGSSTRLAIAATSVLIADHICSEVVE